MFQIPTQSKGAYDTLVLYQCCSTVTSHFNNCCSGLYQSSAHYRLQDHHMLCPVLLKGMMYSLTMLAPLWICSNFCKSPTTCKRQCTKEPSNIKFKAIHIYMHICVHVYIKMHFYTIIYTWKHTNRPHSNIFTSKLICHVIYTENTKKWMVFIFTNKTHSQTHMDFFWHSLEISILL